MKRNLQRIVGVILSVVFVIFTAVPVNAAYFNQESSLSSLLATEGWSYSQEGIRYYRNGQPVIGWMTADGKTYYFNSDGFMQTGWLTLETKRYYFDQSGVMQTGWLQLNGLRYYLGEDGVPITGQQMVNGISCYFSSSGVLVQEGTNSAVPETVQKRLQETALVPKTSINVDLNEKIQSLLLSLDLKNADTFTKVKTVYDFMTSSYSLGTGALFVGMDTFLQIMDGPESDALQMLSTGVGESAGYAAAFASVLRTIGLDARVVRGTLSSNSKKIDHSWVVVKMQDTEYVFDPQQEQVLSGEGRNMYNRFGKTYEELNNIYQPISYFDFQ